MKKLIILLLVSVNFLSCKKFLDTEDLVRRNSTNFPQTRADLNNALAGAYASLGDVQGQMNEPFFWGMIVSDECFGNGGGGDYSWQGMNKLLRSGDNVHSAGWSVNYTGIFRCNSLLDAIDKNANIGFTSDEDRNKFLGEVYALRASYYFNLACLFGANVPLRLKPAVENLPAATAVELYAQIGEDLSKAVALLPNVSIQQAGPANLGHITRWAAQALAARVFLFYTGYYQKSELPTHSTAVTKSQVIDWLKECIANSGHKLLPDYRNNFVYANPLTRPDYKYSRENNLEWAADAGGNTEAVFTVKYSIYRDNRWGLIFGIRNLTKQALFPFRDGWGAGSVNPLFFQQWMAEEPNDIRRNASILDLSDPNENMQYVWGGDQGEETGYVVKKVQNVNAMNSERRILNYSLIAYGAGDGQSSQSNDQVRIRFSDVLLMHSELSGDATGLNQVRSRVHLAPVAFSLQAIQKERRYELAFEGTRYYDLLRWYGTGAGSVLDANQNGAAYFRVGNRKTMNANLTERVAKTGGFLEVPRTEIELSQGMLSQNPGWEGSGMLYTPD